MNVLATLLIAFFGYLLAISAVVTLTAYHNELAAGALLVLAICCSSTSLIANSMR
jgi:hypothetical protein